MTKNALSNPVPYEHTPTETEPGLLLFTGALASLLKTMGEDAIPDFWLRDRGAERSDEGLKAAWLMGVTGFAFMFRAQTDRCGHFGTAMWFDWGTVCPEALAQCGWQCTQFIRFQQEEESVDEEMVQEARAAIRTAIDGGTPVISWGIHDMAWGVIVGYDDSQQLYDVLGKTGMCRWEHEPASIPYSHLTANTTHSLHVIVPGQPSGRTRDQIIRNSLRMAIADAEGIRWAPPSNRSEHWPEAGIVVSGPSAFELWAGEIEWDYRGNGKWRDPFGHHIIQARLLARDYLQMIMGEDPDLREAHSVYENMAELLIPVWRTTLRWHQSGHDKRNQSYLKKPLELVERIRAAGKTEASAIAALRRYIGRTG